MPFTKLNANFASSSIFKLGLDVVGFWAYLLSVADGKGQVTATVPDMAVRCRVDEERVLAMLALLEGPDKWSRTPDNSGQRLRVEREPEWCVHLLNYAKYRAQDNTQAERARKYRDRQAASRRDGVTVCDASASVLRTDVVSESVVSVEGGVGGDPRSPEDQVRGSNFRAAAELDIQILRACREIAGKTGEPAWKVMRRVTSYRKPDGEMSAGVEDPSRLGSVLARQKALEDARAWVAHLDAGGNAA